MLIFQIFGCEEPGQDEGIWNCGEMAQAADGGPVAPPCQASSQILYAWAMDAPDLKLPSNTGFR